MDNTYNGWTNRESWLINLWFGDDWTCAADVQATREWVEEQFEGLESWIQDFIYQDEINWAELEEHARAIEESV